MILFLISLVFPCVLSLQSGTQFISYHVYGDPTSSACFPADYQSKWAGYITANTFGLGCGKCVKMVSGAKTIYVYAIDIGGRGFDLNLPAFCELCGESGGFAKGGCDVNWWEQADTTPCDNFIAGKTKPNCDLCPTGTVCGNPDPARNGGVPWDVYCPQLVGYGMNRCEMRIDGCTCYYPNTPVSPPKSAPVSPPKSAPVSPPKSAPVSPPKSAPVSPPKSAPVAVSTTRCGSTWTDANTKCYKKCQYPEDCGSGQGCYADLDPIPCTAALEQDSQANNAENGAGDNNIGIAIGVACGVGILLVGLIVFALVKRRDAEERV